MTQFKSKQFKDLHKIWMKRLKDEGFADIEDLTSPLEMLKVWDSAYFLARAEASTFKETEEYYQIAVHILETHEFENELEKRIWSLHTDGKSVRTIQKEINIKKVNKDKINKIIQRIQKFIGRR